MATSAAGATTPGKSSSPVKIIAIIGGVLLVVCVIIFAISYFVGKQVLDNLPKQTVEQQLEAAAQTANSKCPVMVDESTKMVAVAYIAPKTLKYTYDILGYSKSDLDVSKFTSIMEPNIITTLKSTADVKWMLDNKVTFIYSYVGEDEQLITDITITPDKYEK